jgi:hypothetical protein
MNAAVQAPEVVLENDAAEDSHMANGTKWIVNTFKLFDALISARRQPQPDRAAVPPSRDPTPEAPAASRPDPAVRPELPPDTDALFRQDGANIETPPTQEVKTLPVQQDEESRRKLIRQLFNEYWAGIDDKPPTFAERLETAERYINERLADRDVGWRLDGVTRKQLGLPSSPIDS